LITDVEPWSNSSFCCNRVFFLFMTVLLLRCSSFFAVGGRVG
jgi:hypothetical protein